MGTDPYWIVFPALFCLNYSKEQIRTETQNNMQIAQTYEQGENLACTQKTASAVGLSAALLHLLIVLTRKMYLRYFCVGSLFLLCSTW